MVYLFIAATAIVLLGSFAVPSLDDRVRFHQRQLVASAAGTGYFSAVGSVPDVDEGQILFSPDQAGYLNEVSAPSLGLAPSSDERLYCLSVSNGVVTRVKLADHFEETKLDTVSGTCRSQFGGGVDGFLHTHPYFDDEPSREDRSVESSSIDFECIQFDQIVETGSGVGGVKCWNPADDSASELADFESVEVRIK